LDMDTKLGTEEHLSVVRGKGCRDQEEASRSPYGL